MLCSHIKKLTHFYGWPRLVNRVFLATGTREVNC